MAGVSNVDPVELECPLCGVAKGVHCHGEGTLMLGRRVYHHERETAAQTQAALDGARWLCVAVDQIESFLARNRRTELPWGLAKLIQQALLKSQEVRQLVTPLLPKNEED